jgi:hypothetical protein
VDQTNIKASSFSSSNMAGERLVTNLDRERASPSLADLIAFEQSWCDANIDIITAAPIGSVLAVNMADGRCVRSTSRLLAMDLFERHFGVDAIAWVHEVGVPLTGGSGLWALSSAESINAEGRSFD